MASNKGRAARTATEAMQVLWEEDFFVGWKKKAAIEADLAKRGNNFNDAELGMALMRARHLTRRGKRGNYEYIQKYPHAIATKKAATGREKVTARKRAK